jgi:hypothetical protein
MDSKETQLLVEKYLTVLKEDTSDNPKVSEIIEKLRWWMGQTYGIATMTSVPLEKVLERAAYHGWIGEFTDWAWTQKYDHNDVIEALRVASGNNQSVMQAAEKAGIPEHNHASANAKMVVQDLKTILGILEGGRLSGEQYAQVTELISQLSKVLQLK